MDFGIKKPINLHVFKLKKFLKMEGFDVIENNDGKIQMIIRVKKEIITQYE